MPDLKTLCLTATLRAAAICILIALNGALGNYTDPVRDAYSRVKTRVLAHPYALNKIPPKVGPNDSVSVRIDFVPYQILFVNEAEMTVTVAATFTIEWDEPAFAWDPALKDNITAVSVSRDDIWTPVIINAKTIDSDHIFIDMPQTLVVYPMGKIRTVQMITLTASCSFDMEWYPFDDQTCSFDFIPFNGESAKINTVALEGGGPLDSFMIGTEKTEWSYGEVKVIQMFAMDDGDPDWNKNLTYTSFQVSMTRMSESFYSTNVVFPVAATAVLVLGVFLIPPSAGEKISYLVSIFISMTVFLSSVSSGMAKSEGNMCRFNVLIAAITIKIIFATAASIFVLRRYTHEQEEKEQEVTSSVPARKERSNACASGENVPRPADPLRYKEDIIYKNFAATETRKSHDNSGSPPVATNMRAFDRSSSAASSETPQTSRTSRLKLQVSGIRRYWRKGERFTSAELDRLFLVIFVAASVIVYTIIMEAR